MNRTEDKYINALKGIAILAVTMVHTGAAELPGIFGKIGNDGARGVQMFFVISGMLAFKSLSRAFPDRKLTVKGVLKWYLRKYIRIAPLYYIAILISMLTASWSTHWLGSEEYVTGKNILTHIFLIHGFFPHYTDSILGVEWYLGVLWIFYLISPVLFLIINSFERSIVFAIFVYIVNPWLIRILAQILPTKPDPYIYNMYLETFGPLSQILIYVIGIILYFFIEKVEKMNIRNPVFFSYILLFFAMILLYGQVNGAANLYRFSRHEMFGSFFGLIVLSQAIHSSKLICNPFFLLVGRYSSVINNTHIFVFLFPASLVEISQKTHR